MSPRHSRMISSTKERWERPNTLYFGWNRKEGFWDARLNILNRYSMQIMNRYGDSGSPCLTPHLLGKKPNSSPLTATKYEAVSTQVITRWTNLSGKPRRRSRCRMKVHWTKSKAFLKSILIRHLGRFFSVHSAWAAPAKYWYCQPYDDLSVRHFAWGWWCHQGLALFCQQEFLRWSCTLHYNKKWAWSR